MSGKQIKFAAKQPKYDLYEMDESTLQDILKQGGAVIKAGEAACLCTESQTYRLKISETSNNLMVLENNEILCTKNVFVEVTSQKPKI